MLNKKAVIIASSLGAIPLTALLIAIVGRRAKHRSLQKSILLKQTRSESNTLANIAPTTHSQQQKEESQPQSEPLRQGFEAMEATTTMIPTTTTTTTATTTSTNTTSTDKDIIIPAGLAVAVPSLIEPSSSTEGIMMASPSHTPKEQEASISDEARKAGESLKELIVAAIKDAKDSAKGTGKRLKEETIDIAATADSKDIQSIGDTLNTLVALFEKTMTEIRKEDYNAQIKLLQSYKDLLKAHIKVANARGMMARKLKPGA
jgi:hypothetical protein